MSKDIRVWATTANSPSRQTARRFRPTGSSAASPGFLASSRYTRHGRGSDVDSKKSGNLLKANGVLRCQMPGAGGYGNPLERSRELLIKDLEEGYVSPESAMRDYA